MKLSQSLEDYLEAIHNEILAKGEAKVTELSNKLNVKKASVTGALISLKSKGLINYEPYSSITLTPLGSEIAHKIIKKHKVITEFLKNILNLTETEAVENACKMEHIMSETMFNRMTKFSSFMQELCKKHPELKEEISKLFE